MLSSIALTTLRIASRINPMLIMTRAPVAQAAAARYTTHHRRFMSATPFAVDAPDGDHDLQDSVRWSFDTFYCDMHTGTRFFAEAMIYLQSSPLILFAAHIQTSFLSRRNQVNGPNKPSMSRRLLKTLRPLMKSTMQCWERNYLPWMLPMESTTSKTWRNTWRESTESLTRHLCSKIRRRWKNSRFSVRDASRRPTGLPSMTYKCMLVWQNYIICSGKIGIVWQYTVFRIKWILWVFSLKYPKMKMEFVR